MFKDMSFHTYNMKTISCLESGFECDYVVKGEADEEAMKRGAEHAPERIALISLEIKIDFRIIL
jgi:predicted small metal-binding protein